jgi:hypothetical protein
MGIFDDIRTKGAAFRLTEEALYAEALREIESGQRRDGIWAKALAESNMDQGKAGARYIKLRVQSLKDEVTLSIAELKQASAAEQKRLAEPARPQLKQSSPEPIATPPHFVSGALQGGVAGFAAFFLFAILLRNEKSQLLPDTTTFFFFVVVGALIGLAFSRKSRDAARQPKGRKRLGEVDKGLGGWF